MCLDNGKHGSIMDSMVYLRSIHAFPCAPEGFKKDQREKTGVATNSEIIRMIQSGSIEINGECLKDFKAKMPCPITSLVFFPRGKRRTTLFWTEPVTENARKSYQRWLSDGYFNDEKKPEIKP